MVITRWTRYRPPGSLSGGGTHSGSNTAGLKDLMGNSSELRNLKASDFMMKNSVCRQ